jgi:hypothetical protein
LKLLAHLHSNNSTHLPQLNSLHFPPCISVENEEIQISFDDEGIQNKKLTIYGVNLNSKSVSSTLQAKDTSKLLA